MELGLSLSPALLSGKPVKEQEKKLLSAFNGIVGFLSELKSRNISNIELRTILPDTDEYLAKEAFDTALSFGFNISVHGKLVEMEGDSFRCNYVTLDYIIRNFKKHQDKLIVVLHAYTSPDTEIEVLVDKSIRTLKQWILHTGDQSIKFAVEINRAKEGRNDPCTTSEGVLNIVNKVGDARVGICWDMGHSYYNVLRDPKYYEITEPFLKKVIHTHIHGLGELGTHCPLTPDSSLPLGENLKMLDRLSYDGIYNLEFSFEKFPADKVVKELMDSIDKINRMSQTF